jgi:hypothetical protein
MALFANLFSTHNAKSSDLFTDTNPFIAAGVKHAIAQSAHTGHAGALGTANEPPKLDKHEAGERLHLAIYVAVLHAACVP